MKYTEDIVSIENVFDSDAIFNIIEKAVNELPKVEIGFILDIDDWKIGITNRQYAQILMLKNRIKRLCIETNTNGDDYVVVYYTDESFKTYFVKKEIFKGDVYYSVDDNPLKDLNKILYYYFK